MTALMGSRGTGQAGQPTWWASWVVRAASLPLPAGYRSRYRCVNCGAQQDRGSMGPPNTIGA